ncbi:HYR domain-containing protein [Flavobacterium aestivum]|uniref:HYR domain-containing protein n=1 Tax=Flavobacterium aestivum TaxID=3003257 RepID=UPI002482D709|nr:HYR domain-containing protein [Flavobacterium aestivum]
MRPFLPKFGILAIIFFIANLFFVNVTVGQVTQPTAWTKAYDQVSGTGTTSSFAIANGSNRILIVAISCTTSSSANGTEPSPISYGGITLTRATSNVGTSGRMHTYLYYLKDNAVMDNTSRALNVTLSGTLLNMTVWYAVYANVNQAATYATGNNLNNNSGSGPAQLSAAMAVNANDQAIYITSVYNDTNTTLPGYTINGNWTSGGSNTGTGGGFAWKVEVAKRTIPVSNTTDAAATSAITPSGSIRYAESAMSLPITPPTIATSAISGSPFCVGATVTVPYTITGTYIAGNVFTAQLSNSSGSFASPTTIGTNTSTSAGSISATIPIGQASGTAYRIRVIASTPSTTGTDNGSDLVITKPTASAGAALSSICQGGTSAALGGTVGGSATGGTWSDGGVGGTFNAGDTNLNTTWTPPPGYTGTATLTLTTSGGACGTTTASKTQVVIAPSTASAGGSQTICTTGTATVSGASASNGTILWTHNGTGTLSNATTLTPTYTPTTSDPGNNSGLVTLTMTVSNGVCPPVTATYQVTVQIGPIVDAGVDRIVCSTNPNVSLAGSVSGSVDSGTWSSSGSGTFSPDNVTLSATYIPSPADITAGTVTLTLTSYDPYQDPINFPCYVPVTDQMLITIKPAPTATAGGNQSICPNGTATVSGATSSNGTILWTHDGGGSLTNATTLTPTYTPSAADAITDYGNGVGVVTLTMIVSNSPCSPVVATYTVKVNPFPLNKSLSGTTAICSGNSTNIQVLSSETGINYQLRNNTGNVNVGSPVAGTGGTIDLPTGSLTNATTYNVLATNATTSCSAQMSGTITISINPLPPNRTVAATAATLCTGTGTTITVALSTATTTTYQLRNNSDNSLIGSPVTGNGATINLPTGNLINNTASPVVMTFNVLATITATGCTAQMSVTPTVTVSPLIAGNTISADQTICSGATPVALSGSLPTGGNGTYAYGWFQSTDNFVANNVNASTTNGSRTLQNYSPPSLTQTTWFRRTVTSDGCTDTSLAVQITINPLPTAFSVSGGGAYCAGSSGVPVGLGNSQTGINYQLFLGASPDGSPVAGTGSAISFGIKTAAGTYTVVATNATTNCTSNMTGSATITINPVPTTVGASVCLGGSGTLSSPTVCPAGTPTSSGPNNAGAGADNAAVGTGIWTTPGNITTAGTPYATQNLASNATTHYLQGSNYGFAIPAGAVINGITVTINRQVATTTNMTDTTVRLVKGGTVVGSNLASGTSWPNAFGTATYGGTSNLWGTTWTAADINATTFGVVLSGTSTSGSTRQVDVDYMRITVTYTANGVINWYTASSGGSSIGTGSPFNPVGVLNSGLPNTNTAGTTPFYAECSSVPGCRTVADFVVVPLPTVSASKTNVSCHGLADGTISVSGVSAGASTIIQLNGAGPDLSAQTTFAPGTYVVTASKPNGSGFCTSTASVTITEPIAVTVNASKTNVSCHGLADGTISISGLSAGASTTIQLDGAGPDLSAQTTFAPGTYLITATAANGNADGFCTATTSVTITEPIEVTVSASKTNVSCHGLADGTISVSGVSAGASTTIQLDGAGPDLSAQTSFAAGTYLITATAPNGNADGFCTATASVTITEPIEVTVSASKTNVSCNGAADGTISISGLSAGASTTIQLDGAGPDLSEQTTFAPGTYLITASAPNGNTDGFCTATTSVTITEPIEVTVSASKTNVSCNGLVDGTISISGVSAGASTTIQLDGTGPDLSAQTTFAPGTYLITATAANGNADGFCTATASVTITEPIEVTVSASKTNASCYGASDGTISISGLSEGASTTIQLDGVGSDLSAQTSFAAGTYLITASAPNGNADGFCTATTSVTISQPIEVTVSASKTNVSCNGAADGTISISGVSAGANTTIQLDGAGPDLSAQTTFAPGTYVITASAPNDNEDGFCTATTSVTITEPIEVTVSASKTNVSCNGLADGTISISGLSASASTIIQLDGTGPDLSAQTTFAPGTYLITATAPNGNADGFCTATTSVTITEPIEVTVSASKTNVSCNGLTDGTISISGLSAGASTTIQLDGTGPDLSAQTSFAAGTYLITASAPNGNTDGFCTATTSVTITQPIEVTVSASKTNVSCNGLADGTISISGVSAGASTTIQLDGTGPDLSAQTTFAPGTYLITATAPNGNADGFCTATASVTITEPIQVTVSASNTNVSCKGVADGTISISGLSAGASTTIQLDGAGPDLSAQTSFAAGTYLITASASNGNADGFCTATTSVTITEPDELTASITAQTDVDCFGNSNGSATVTPTGGTPDYTYLWDDPSAQTTATATNLSTGTYHVTVTDDHGCTTNATATIIVSDSELPVVITQNIDAELNASGNASITAAQINNGSHDNCAIQSISVSPNTFTCANVGPNTVTLTVTDTNGNINTGTATVTVKDLIAPVISGMPANKIVTLAANSCTKAVGWTPPTATDSCGMASLLSSDDDYNTFGSTSLSAGVHTITYTATDINGNSSTASFTVTVLDNISPTITGCPNNITINTDNNICGARAFYLLPTASDNCTGVSMNINNSNYLSGNIFPLGTTTVIWTATDASSNTAVCSFTVTVEDHQAPVPSLAALPTVTGECTATAPTPTASDNCDLTINGVPNAPTTYNTPGTYTITWTYTDTHGNSSSQNQTVNVTGTPPAINTQPVSLSKCEGQSATFSVNATATGYLWQVNTGSGWSDIATETSSSLNFPTVTSAMNGNMYRVKISNLCSSITSAEVQLTVNSTLTVSDQPNQNLCNTSSFTMTQSPPSIGTGAWTLISGSAAITTANSPTSTITGVAAGTSATVRWTVTSGACSAYDEVTVTNTMLPSVSDQPNQNLCSTSSFTMTQSTPLAGTGIWTLINGSAAITTDNSPTTTITGVAAGTSATVRWTVTNGPCSAYDDVTVTNTTLPSVSDQANQTSCNTSSFTMTQSTPSIGSGVWTLISGTATITTASSPTTTITGVAVGTSATVRWTVTNGSCNAFDEVKVTNTILPSVSDQPNQASCNTPNFTMTQSAPSAGTGTWTLINGSAAITTASSPTTTITGVPAGTSATVRWTVTNIDCSSYDDVTVTNSSLSVVSDQPNQSLCNTSSFTMTQSAPSAGSGIWTLINGSAAITTASSPTTSITGVTAGTSATLRWTVTNGSCSGFDDVTVTNTTLPTVSDQPNQTLCNTSSFTMTQTGSGTWTLIGGSATITTASSPTTTITGVAVGTSATVRWTTGSGICTAYDDVMVTNNAVTPFTASITASSPDAFCSGLTLTANPSIAGSYSYSWSPGGATTQSITLYNSASVGMYTVTVTQIGGLCGSSAQATYNFQPQNNINAYGILGLTEVNLSDNNFVQISSVGVTGATGVVKIGQSSSVAGTGAFVKAKNITVQPFSSVPVRIFSPATVTLPAMQLNSSSTTGLSDLVIANNTTVTKTGNFKNVTIGSNCNVTFSTGTIFGIVTIGKSSQVKFNANGTGTLNITRLVMSDGTNSASTKLLFGSDMSIRIKEYADVGKSTLINTTGGYKAVFYIGGTEFHVASGGNTTVNASIYAPNGTIRIEGDPAKNTTMNGFYIASKVLSINKNIYWNPFDCANPTAKINNTESIATREASPEIVPFDVKAYPNPSNYQFTIEVIGGSTEKIEADVFDMQARIIKHIESFNSQSILFGEDLPAGTYITIVTQGANRKTVKLIKK